MHNNFKLNLIKYLPQWHKIKKTVTMSMLKTIESAPNNYESNSTKEECIKWKLDIKIKFMKLTKLTNKK